MQPHCAIWKLGHHCILWRTMLTTRLNGQIGQSGLDGTVGRAAAHAMHDLVVKHRTLIAVLFCEQRLQRPVACWS